MYVNDIIPTILHLNLPQNKLTNKHFFFLISGTSPNYKDLKGLTPLYYCVSNAADVVCVELLLHDRSIVGATDLQARSFFLLLLIFS